MWKISVKSMLAHRRRLVRTCSAVLLGVAFLAGTLVLGDTMRGGFSQAFEQAYAGTDVVVQGDDTMGADMSEQRRLVPAAVLDELRALDSTDRAVGSIVGFAQLIGADGEPIGGEGPPTFGENWIDDDANPYDLVEGRAPGGAGEVVIDRGTATTGQLGLGDVTTVRTPRPVDATVVGIAAFGTSDSIGGSGYIAFSEEEAREYLLQGADGYTGIFATAVDGTSAEQYASEVAGITPDGFEVLTGTEATAQAEQAIGEDFLDMFQMFLLVFTGVALLVASFSIYNTFSVILAQRSRESALLRAIGATRAQVLGSIGLEAVVIGIVASIGGLVVGLGLAAGLNVAMRSIGVDLPGGIQVEPTSVLVSLVVGLVVTLLASLAPAIRASGVAPLSALRDATVDRSDASTLRTVLGAVLTLGGMALVLIAAIGTPDAALALVGYGAVACVAGIVTLGPVVARPATRLLGAPLTFRGRASGVLARGNAMRNPRRTAGTASALMIGVGVVALFTVVGSSMSAMVRQAVVGTVAADLLVVDESFSGSGMDPSLSDDLAGLPEVSSAVGLSYGVALLDGEETEFSVSDPAPFAAALDIETVAGSLAELETDEIAVSAAEAEARSWELGDTVQVDFIDGATETVTVGAIHRQSQMAGDVVMPRQMWSAHAVREVDAVSAISLVDGVSTSEGRRAVDALTAAAGAPSALTPDEYADDVAGEINQLLSIVYVLLALSIIIALMGITNTLALSIHERTRELGLLRAIGQTRVQMRSMVRYESVVIALFGTVGGLGLGLFLAWGLVSALGSIDAELTAFSAPAGTLVAIAVIGGLAGVLAGVRPARRAARLDVLEAIASQ